MSLLLPSIIQQVFLSLCYTGDFKNHLHRKFLDTLGGQRIIYLHFNFDFLKQSLLSAFFEHSKTTYRKKQSERCVSGHKADRGFSIQMYVILLLPHIWSWSFFEDILYWSLWSLRHKLLYQMNSLSSLLFWLLYLN